MKVRFPKFDFSTIQAHWTRVPEFAQRANSASLSPAYIEPYLLKVMNQAKPLLDKQDKALAAELDIFIKQEMQHCRQHLNFNKRLHELGYTSVLPVEKKFEDDYNRFLATKPLRFNLAYAEGFESLSATSCEQYFEDFDEYLEGAHPEPTNMWRWHLAEEWEHRTVCSDVYHKLSGLNPVFRYFYRLYGYFYAVVHISTFITRTSKLLLDQDRAMMTPDELKVALARDKLVKKVLARRFISTAFMICSPFYDPKNRRKPKGYDEYLKSFEAKYDREAAAVAA